VNTLDLGGIGVSSTSGLAWLTNTNGYVGTFVNTDATAVGRGGLLIKTAATDAASYPLQINVGASNAMTVRGDRNVGIGTTGPNSKLQVSGNIYMGPSGNKLFFDGTPTTDENYLIMSNAWNVGMDYRHFTAHRFFTNADITNPKLYIAISGNVGIGTIAPKGILHIENSNARITTYDTDAAGPSAARPAWLFGSQGASFSIQSAADYTTAVTRMTIEPVNGNMTVASLAGTGTVLLQADAAGLISRSVVASGNMVLLYNNETSVSGVAYANTTAFTYNVVGTFSQVKVEADIENDCSGGASVSLQGWNYKIVYNGVTTRTAQLLCGDKVSNDDWLSGHVTYMGAVANGQTVKIDVINTGTAGTWYVRNFRVYGIY
jgi:hypothetical protein